MTPCPPDVLPLLGRIPAVEIRRRAGVSQGTADRWLLRLAPVLPYSTSPDPELAMMLRLRSLGATVREAGAAVGLSGETVARRLSGVETAQDRAQCHLARLRARQAERWALIEPLLRSGATQLEVASRLHLSRPSVSLAVWAARWAPPADEIGERCYRARSAGASWSTIGAQVGADNPRDAAERWARRTGAAWPVGAVTESLPLAVVRLRRCGHTHAQIAEALGVSQWAVRRALAADTRRGATGRAHKLARAARPRR